MNKTVYSPRPVAIGGQRSKLWVGVCDWPTARPHLVLAISRALRGLHSQKPEQQRNGIREPEGCVVVVPSRLLFLLPVRLLNLLSSRKACCGQVTLPKVASKFSAAPPGRDTPVSVPSHLSSAWRETWGTQAPTTFWKWSSHWHTGWPQISFPTGLKITNT